jgi:hypothetical protein
LGFCRFLRGIPVSESGKIFGHFQPLNLRIAGIGGMAIKKDAFKA